MLLLKQVSRSLQRRIFIGVASLCVWAIAWPLLRPNQPPLPELPTIQQLPGEWKIESQALSRQLPDAIPSRRFHPLGSPAALGATRTFVRPNGDWIRLTPMASWTRSGFSIELATKGILKLSNQPYQSCLTRTGRIGRDNLSDLIGVADKMLSRPQRLWHILLPVRNRSYSCLIITSNIKDLLANSTEFDVTRDYLKDTIQWPDPPALSQPGTKPRV